MASYNIQWKRSAQKELQSLDRQVIPKIINTVETLSTNPYPANSKKLVGSEHTFRLRVGDYRIIYNVMDTLLVIEIIRVRHRKEVYV